MNDEDRALIFSAIFILRGHIWLNYGNDIGIFKHRITKRSDVFKKVVDSQKRDDNLGMILDWGSYVPGGDTEKLVTELINELPFLSSVYNKYKI